MRKLIGDVFLNSMGPSWRQRYRLPGLLFLAPHSPVRMDVQLDLYWTADARIINHVTNEGMSKAMPASPDHLFAPILNPARKAHVSRTLKNAELADTTVAPGETIEEIDKLRQGGGDHSEVWGGVRM